LSGAAGEGPLLEPGPPRELDVVGLGEISLDLVSRVSSLPAPGGKAHAIETDRLPGGQVASALLGCARLGLRCAYVGSVGDDPAGREALAPLAAAGVDLSGVVVRPGAPSRTAQIWVERTSGERSIVACRDPRLALAPDELPLERIRAARLLHLDATDLAASLAAAAAAREAGIPVVLDADDDALADGVEELLQRVDFPVVAATFAETLYGTTRREEALERLLAAGARMAVLTAGLEGALAGDGERVWRAPAFPVAARDTTGAGDAFHAGFIWGLLEGLPADGVLAAAAAAAAINCRAPGAQTGLPERAELEAFLARAEQGGSRH